MSKPRRFWQGIKNSLRSVGGDFGMFGSDLLAKTYEKVVDNLAAVIAAGVVAVLLYFGGADKIIAFWNSRLDQEENYVERQISGRIYDSETDSILTDVRVGLVRDTINVLTDSTGLFKLQFRAHKDSLCVELSLMLYGYETDQRLHDIPLAPDKAEEIQDFTLTPLSSEN